MGSFANETFLDNETFAQLRLSPQRAVGDVIQRILLPIVCGCGIVGLILTIVVLSRKNMRTSTNCYLIALSIFDLLFLVLLSINLFGRSMLIGSDHENAFVIYASFAAIFTNIFLIASIWLTVMLTVERNIAICHPFLAVRFCTPRRAVYTIIAVFVFSTLCRLPNFFEHKLFIIKSENYSMVYLGSSNLVNDELYMTVYPWIVDCVISSIIPFLCLLILNVRLVYKVRQSTVYLQRHSLTSDNFSVVHKEEIQVTIMLISIVIIFFFCQAPYVIYSAVNSINKSNFTDDFFLLLNVTLLFMTLKSAVNFIAYCWFSEKFWISLKETIRCRGCSNCSGMPMDRGSKLSQVTMVKLYLDDQQK